MRLILGPKLFLHFFGPVVKCWKSFVIVIVIVIKVRPNQIDSLKDVFYKESRRHIYMCPIVLFKEKYIL